MSDKEEMEQLRKAARENWELMSKSEAFFLIFSEHMLEEVIPLMQMGLAVYLDKPFLILVPKGAKVPMNVRRLAVALEEYVPGDEQSLKKATERLFAKVHQ